MQEKVITTPLGVRPHSADKTNDDEGAVMEWIKLLIRSVR